MAAVVVVGEAVVDVLVDPRTGTETRRPGGSPANVAVALGRLGHPTSLVTCLADDPDGALLRRHLEGSGVELLCPTSSASTSTARAVLEPDGQATYAMDLRWDISAAAGLSLAEASVLHVGSVSATTEPGCQQVLGLVQRAHRHRQALVSYDLNCRPSLMGSPQRVLPLVERLASLCDLVKLSDEDADWLYGGADAFDRLHELGAPLVVLTRGAEGCVASTASGRIAVPAAPGGPVQDTVGAGDAFMAGLLAGLREGRQLRAALELATVVARRTCERIGADPPALADLGIAGADGRVG